MYPSVLPCLNENKFALIVPMNCVENTLGRNTVCTRCIFFIDNTVHSKDQIPHTGFPNRQKSTIGSTHFRVELINLEEKEKSNGPTAI